KATKRSRALCALEHGRSGRCEAMLTSSWVTAAHKDKNSATSVWPAKGGMASSMARWRVRGGGVAVHLGADARVCGARRAAAARCARTPGEGPCVGLYRQAA